MDRAVSELLRIQTLGAQAMLEAAIPLAEYGQALSRLNGGAPAANPGMDNLGIHPMLGAQANLMAVTTRLFAMVAQLLAPANPNALNSPLMPNQGSLPNGLGGAATGPNMMGGAAATNAPAYDNKGDQGSAKGFTGEWKEQDQQMLDKAITSAGDASKFDKIFSQFGQSSEGNCASVAVIKGAMDKYDGKVFNSVQKSGDGYAVTLKDGKSVTISGTELRSAAKAAKWKGQPNEAKSLAILMFAVIAKRGAAEKGGNFDSMLRDLDNGFNTKKAAQLLGLKTRDVKPSEAANKDGVVGSSGRHAVYIDSGKTDHYGTAKAFNNTDTNGRGLTSAFEFV
jgi:hypothetical protein